MKVRMILPMSGLRGSVEWPPPGETLEVGPDEGAQLCRSGIAVPVAEDPPVETATMPIEAEEKREPEETPVSSSTSSTQPARGRKAGR